MLCRASFSRLEDSDRGTSPGSLPIGNRNSFCMYTEPRPDMLSSRRDYRSSFRSDWLAIVFHYVVLLWVFHGMVPWLLFMTLCKGFMTGVVVFSTHYGEDILENGGELALVEQTALTSRNITGGYVMNLLTGYVHVYIHKLYNFHFTNRPYYRPIQVLRESASKLPIMLMRGCAYLT